MIRLIGLDHGSRRIGVAVGDTETGLAFTRPAITARSRREAIDAVVALAGEERTRRVVIGLPLNMAGDEGRQAAAARAFGAQLSELGLEVTYLDERLSSWQAADDLAADGRRPSRASGELDSAAARLILQEYLDMSSRPR